ncbi:MAG: hypothetical protein VYD23_01425, partial [Candidatus Thermoplasmatota archaeon]|nr:hypothetical protein [Candidatus Thermoplasmatota archaeon]
GFNDISCYVAHTVALNLDYEIVITEEKICVGDTSKVGSGLMYAGFRAWLNVNQHISHRHVRI